MDVRKFWREVDLDNAGKIVTDRTKSPEQRIVEFLEQMMNLYAENVGVMF